MVQEPHSDAASFRSQQGAGSSTAVIDGTPPGIELDFAIDLRARLDSALAAAVFDSAVDVVADNVQDSVVEDLDTQTAKIDLRLPELVSVELVTDENPDDAPAAEMVPAEVPASAEGTPAVVGLGWSTASLATAVPLATPEVLARSISLAGLDCNDVALEIGARAIAAEQVDLAVRIGTSLTLRQPVLGYSTSASSAIEIAHDGGLAILAAAPSLETLLAAVNEVKSAAIGVSVAPAVVGPNATIGEVRVAMAQARGGCVVIVDLLRRPIGLMTRGDLIFVGAHSDREFARDRLRRPTIVGQRGTPVSELAEMMRSYGVKHLPLVDAHGRLFGLASGRPSSRTATTGAAGSLACGVEIGVDGDVWTRAHELAEIDCDLLVVDPRAHSNFTLAAIVGRLVDRFSPMPVFAKINTADSMDRIARSGAAGVLISGVGGTQPTLSAINEIAVVLSEVAGDASGVRPMVIAEVANSGASTVAKAIAAGADAVVVPAVPAPYTDLGSPRSLAELIGGLGAADVAAARLSDRLRASK